MCEYEVNMSTNEKVLTKKQNLLQNNVEYQGHLKVKVILRYVGEMVLNNVCDYEVNSLTNEQVIGVYASWSDLPHHIFWVPYGRYKTQHWASNHF